MEFSISEFKAYKDIYIICKYFNLSVEMFQKNSDLLNVKSNTSSKINKRKTENLGNVEYYEMHSMHYMDTILRIMN